MKIFLFLMSFLPALFLSNNKSDQFEFKTLLSRQGQATYSISEKNQRVFLSEKGKIIGYEAENARTITYDMSGKVQGINSENVIYDFQGQLIRLGPWKIDYDFENKIAAINDWRVNYDLDGRIVKFDKIDINYDPLNGRLTDISGSRVSYDFLTGSISKIEKVAGAGSASIVFFDSSIANFSENDYRYLRK
jgi:uncharacterized protein YuzE